jgi:hypothetical protein
VRLLRDGDTLGVGAKVLFCLYGGLVTVLGDEARTRSFVSPAKKRREKRKSKDTLVLLLPNAIVYEARVSLSMRCSFSNGGILEPTLGFSPAMNPQLPYFGAFIQ